MFTFLVVFSYIRNGQTCFYSDYFEANSNIPTIDEVNGWEKKVENALSEAHEEILVYIINFLLVKE